MVPVVVALAAFFKEGGEGEFAAPLPNGGDAQEAGFAKFDRLSVISFEK